MCFIPPSPPRTLKGRIGKRKLRRANKITKKTGVGCVVTLLYTPLRVPIPRFVFLFTRRRKTDSSKNGGLYKKRNKMKTASAQQVLTLKRINDSLRVCSSGGEWSYELTLARTLHLFVFGWLRRHGKALFIFNSVSFVSPP